MTGVAVVPAAFPSSALRGRLRPAFRRLALAAMVAAAAIALSWTTGALGGDAAVTVEDRLERRMRVELWGSDFAGAALAFRRAAGVELMYPRIMRGGADARAAARPIYLVTGDVSARTAVEMLTRTMGCRYRWKNPQVWLVDGYEWLDEPGVMRSLSVESLLLPGETPAALEARLGEAARVVPLLPGTGRRWEFALRSLPTGAGARLNCRLETFLPHTLQIYVEQMVNVLSTEGEAVPTSRRPVRPIPPDPGNLLVSIRLKDAPALDALRELALQTGWSIGMDSAVFAEQPPKAVALDLGHVPAREAAGALARELGLGGAERWRDGVVWLARRTKGWERGRSDREVLWDGLVTHGFAVGGLVTAVGGWEPLRERLRRNVTPWIWDDPMVAMVYQPGNGTLGIRAPETVIQALREELSRQ